MKVWGNCEYWGLGYDFDPQWVLTDGQKLLQTKLIEVCEKVLRPNAIDSDRHLTYPRKNFEALAELGLLGLFVPKEWGGLGENHTCAAMVVETIARYGCPSTAMCYTMHLGATAAALFRAHDNPELQSVLKRLDKDVFIGTLSYSDPETGSHFWYPVLIDLSALRKFDITGRDAFDLLQYAFSRDLAKLGVGLSAQLSRRHSG
jgi:Acyl-CoA dehydrogenases